MNMFDFVILIVLIIIALILFVSLFYPPLQSLSYHCKRCAIVSSSGQLLGRGAGPEIDRNECVFRMNDAPTTGFENDVGTRTSVRVIGHRNLGRMFANQEDLQEKMFSNQSSEKVFVHWSYLTDIDADKVGEYALVLKLMEKYPNLDFVMFTPQKMKFAEKLFHLETDLTRYDMTFCINSYII